MLLGMGAPVHVLQTGDDVNAIVQITSDAVMNAMGREEKAWQITSSLSFAEESARSQSKR